MSAREPLRWTEPGAGAEPELSEALRAWRGLHGDDAQVRALRERLAPELAAPTVAGSATVTFLWLKLLLGGLVPLVVGWLAFSYLTRSVLDDATASRSAEATRVAPAPALPALRAPVPAPAQEPSARELAAPGLPTRHAVRANAMRVQPARAPSPERELALLQRAQAALDHSPATVLVLTAEHERDHPKGIFTQEREILAIEALLKLGRRQAAHARAEQFVQRFAGSPHTRRVRALLERTPASKEQTTEPGTDD